MSFTENISSASESQSNKLCPVCGDPLCPHGVCRKAEPEYSCDLCLDPYSVVMDAMKYVSVTAGPAMGQSEYRAFMSAMKVFSQATREIGSAKFWGRMLDIDDDDEPDEPNVGDPPPPSDHEKRSLR